MADVQPKRTRHSACEIHQENRMVSSTLQTVSSDLARIAEQVGKSVVAVHGRSRSRGSGIQWRKGVIVTAHHAVGHEEVAVIGDSGKSISAQLAGRDPSTDLAVLKISDDAMPAVPDHGDSTSLKLGHLVLALGRSWRGSVVASAGIIGGVSGELQTRHGGRLDQHIRVALELYSGMSGGPLVDADGHIVGVNTNGLDRGRPITIPRSTVDRIVSELLEKGHIARPHLGLAMQPVRLPETLRIRAKSATTGLLTVYVQPGGPAEQAGVILGDILVELRGKSLEDLEEVHALLRQSKIGDSVAVTVLRGGNPATLNIVLGDRGAQ
jgi:S1-C subfamily serine protease